MKHIDSGKLILSIICILLLAILCFLFGTDSIDLSDNNSLDNEVTESIKYKQVNDASMCNDTSSLLFNGISISLDNGEKDSCDADNIIINDNKINFPNMKIQKYIVYDKYVLIQVENTGGKHIDIYNIETKKMEKSIGHEELSGYRLVSFTATENNIIILGSYCGAQCGLKETIYQSALFEITYKDNLLSDPKLIEQLEYQLKYSIAED